MNMSTIWQKIEFVSTKMFTFLWPFIQQFMKDTGPILAEAALAAVKVVEESAIGNSQTDPDGTIRKQAAFAQIKQTLVAKGVEVIASEINSAIEVAVKATQAGA